MLVTKFTRLKPLQQAQPEFWSDTGWIFLPLTPLAVSINSKILGLWACILKVFIPSSIMMPQVWLGSLNTSKGSCHSSWLVLVYLPLFALLIKFCNLFDWQPIFLRDLKSEQKKYY